MGEPVLRRAAAPVLATERADGQLAAWVRDLIDTMRDAKGAGLAAPQIFVPKCVCVIEVNENPRYPQFPVVPLTVLVNPRLTPVVESHDVLLERETISIYEGCLSIPGIRGRVTRPRKIRVQAEDQDGNPVDFVWEGVRAAIVQHETDHLRGALFIDHADRPTLSFTEEFDQYIPVSERVVDGAERNQVERP
jgi:peptide deformylase